MIARKKENIIFKNTILIVINDKYSVYSKAYFIFLKKYTFNLFKVKKFNRCVVKKK